MILRVAWVNNQTKNKTVSVIFSLQVTNSHINRTECNCILLKTPIGFMRH